MNVPNFLLLVISNLVPFWTENIPCLIPILLCLLGFVLWPAIWSTLESVPCALRRMCVLSYVESPQRGTVVVVVQSLSPVPLFETPSTEAHQSSLSFTITQSLFKFMSV